MATKHNKFIEAIKIKTKKFLSNEKNVNVLVPMIAIFLGFFTGVVIMIFTGRDPIDIFRALIRATAGIDVTRIGTDLEVFNPRYFGEFLVFSMPVILTGLSVAFAFRTGLFNVGAEGQMMAGGFAAVAVGILLDLPMVIHLPLAIFAGILFGALWGFIPGLLKAKFNVHEVVVTIMMNYIALYAVNYAYKQLPGSNDVKTVPVHETASLASEFLSELTNNSRLHWGIIPVILAVIVFWLIIQKTTFGFELRSAGFNKYASRYAGMKVDRNIILSMMISGAFAGLAGVMISIGTFDYGRVLSAAEGYGFDGIAVALVGNTSAVGSLLAGLLFGALKAAQPLMQARFIPKDIANIIIAAIVIFVAMQSGIRQFLHKVRGKEE